jgi:hypothetical protein
MTPKKGRRNLPVLKNTIRSLLGGGENTHKETTCAVMYITVRERRGHEN